MKVELIFIVVVALATSASAFGQEVTAGAGYQGEGPCTVAHRKG